MKWKMIRRNRCFQGQWWEGRCLMMNLPTPRQTPKWPTPFKHGEAAHDALDVVACKRCVRGLRSLKATQLVLGYSFRFHSSSSFFCIYLLPLQSNGEGVSTTVLQKPRGHLSFSFGSSLCLSTLSYEGTVPPHPSATAAGGIMVLLGELFPSPGGSEVMEGTFLRSGAWNGGPVDGNSVSNKQLQTESPMRVELGVEEASTWNSIDGSHVRSPQKKGTESTRGLG